MEKAYSRQEKRNPGTGMRDLGEMKRPGGEGGKMGAERQSRRAFGEF